MTEKNDKTPGRVGVIVAMKAELEALLRILSDSREEERSGFRFYLGKAGGRDIVAMQCGIGKVNAAMGTAAMLEHYSPSVVINTGIAGGTGRGPGILDVVVADEVAYHDVWCGPGNERGQVQGFPPKFACATGEAGPFDLGKVLAKEGVHRGLIASGDMFVDTPAELARILSVHPDAVAVDMESGAIAQVCAFRGVPFLAVRVISDYPGAEDHISQYLNFWNDAPRSTFAILATLLEG